MKNETIILDSEDEPKHSLGKKKTKNLGHVAAGERRRFPENQSPAVPKKAPEHIGHVLIDAESKAERDQSSSLGTEKRIETMSRAELLGMSEKILVDGTTLRQIYETHLIGERGLRRLIAEYVRGGELKKALRQEVVEREIDFERDPVLRDMVPGYQVSTQAGINSADLTKLLEKVTIDGVDGSEEAAFYKARAHYEAQELVQHRQQRRVIDAVIAVILLILVALIIVLIITRG